jgi:hypothetical protein
MADVVHCIPCHAFNDHSKCGTWCGYLQDKVNYDHNIVLGGFNDQRLFEELRDIFQKITSNAEKFSCDASSNINENLNASMTRKAPKLRYYGMTASA